MSIAWLDGRMTWRDWLRLGLLPPVMGGAPDPDDGGGGGGGDGDGTDDDGKMEMVPRAQLDEALQRARRRDQIARQKQQEVARLRAEFERTLEALGIDLPEDEEERKRTLEQLAEERRKREAGKTLSKDEVDRIFADAKKKWDKDLEGERTKAQGYFAKLREVLIQNEALKAASDLGAMEGGLEFIRLRVEREADILEEDGELRAVIKGRDGPRINAKGELLTVREYVEEIANDPKYAVFFKSSGRSGGGSGGSDTGSSLGTRRRITQAELEALPFSKKEEVLKKFHAGEIEIVA